MGDDPRSIVEEGDQIGLATSSVADQDFGAVHDIAHPQLAGLLEGEAAPITLGACLARDVHQSMAHEQPMDGGGRQR